MIDTAPLLELVRRIAAATAPRPRTRTRASRAQKHRVWQRAGGACEGCGSREGLAVHHVVPAARGGTNRRGNLKLMCEGCEPRDHRRARLPPK